ncbi:2-amino-4-hydroxy-6-hydroxymethyldihydropteridine diphosphokinase [Thermoactinomyces mirandus]|uniref:2-amino-4-hydroxy-6-hydroxymethyldihydropteridine diphosphokinase n=1 Tax=Thermoactinomyces mirandus TaxID=2756294 RepID=A0A7W1XQ89_9BACL|nr:2-amino-4-hydroxy-6-hydroxymethyldihydropteridine diphosphokinase [Thermoactinomyces mirandus]MBA4601273.1 2-amino-4-hydroxy-6-hydroxymethyldihydropteridine diphosphokinase [Thermoactinomyces mirandus]
MNRKVTAYLGLGANLGDRKKQLDQAIERLNHTRGIRVKQRSSLYETAPVGYVDQPPFYNQVIKIQTTFMPEELLENLLLIERELHRVRQFRWGPRTIDIDLLIYEDYIIQQENLTVPHPRMTERAFVLVPLLEIAGDLLIPGTDKKISEWIAELPGRQDVRKLEATEFQYKTNC